MVLSFALDNKQAVINLLSNNEYKPSFHRRIILKYNTFPKTLMNLDRLIITLLLLTLAYT